MPVEYVGEWWWWCGRGRKGGVLPSIACAGGRGGGKGTPRMSARPRQRVPLPRLPSLPPSPQASTSSPGASSPRTQPWTSLLAATPHPPRWRHAAPRAASCEAGQSCAPGQPARAQQAAGRGSPRAIARPLAPTPSHHPPKHSPSPRALAPTHTPLPPPPPRHACPCTARCRPWLCLPSLPHASPPPPSRPPTCLAPSVHTTPLPPSLARRLPPTPTSLPLCAGWAQPPPPPPPLSHAPQPHQHTLPITCGPPPLAA